MNFYQMLAPKVGEYSRDSFSGRPNHLSNFLMCKGQSNAVGRPSPRLVLPASAARSSRKRASFSPAEPESPR